MNTLEEVKLIVEGKNKSIPFAQDVDKLIRESQILTDNAARIRYALDSLQNQGINLVINADFKNSLVRIFDYDFEELVKNGYYPKIEDNKGIIMLDGVRVEAQLNPNQAEEFKKIVEPFNFWYTDKNANSYDAFKTRVKEVPVESVEHHVYNDDFANWVENALYKKDLSEKIRELKDTHFEGEDLRDALIELLF